MHTLAPGKFALRKLRALPGAFYTQLLQKDSKNNSHPSIARIATEMLLVKNQLFIS